MGNNKTQDFIIEREIKHPINAKLDSNMVNEDITRLENLGIFSEVKWVIAPLDDGTAVLMYIITESIQKTPPFAFPFYDEKTGWSLQGLWLVNNFRGRNEEISIIGSIGGKNTYGINFNNPWVSGDHISFYFNMQKTLFVHRYLSEDVSLNSFKIGLGKWFGYKIKSFAEIELITKKFSSLNTKHVEKFDYFNPNFNLRYDSRDVYWNPSRGFLISQNFDYNKGIKPEDLEFLSWRQSYAWFVTLKKSKNKIVLGVNNIINRRYGDKNKFWIEYFGGSSTIRGWSLPDSNIYKYKKFRFGHESCQTSIELRYDVIPKYVTSQGIESGLTFVLFFDRGLINDSWEMLKKTAPLYGSGFGIRIPFPMIGVIRIDYGWGYRDNIWSSGVFHLSFGQKF